MVPSADWVLCSITRGSCGQSLVIARVQPCARSHVVCINETPGTAVLEAAGDTTPEASAASRGKCNLPGDAMCTTIDTILVNFRRVLAASKRSMSVAANEVAKWTKQRKKKWWAIRRHVHFFTYSLILVLVTVNSWFSHYLPSYPFVV